MLERQMSTVTLSIGLPMGLARLAMPSRKCRVGSATRCQPPSKRTEAPA